MDWKRSWEVEVAVVGHLPIRTFYALASDKMTRVQTEMVQHGVVAVEERIDIDALTRGDAAEDDSSPLEHGKLGEPMARHVDFAEVRLVEDADEIALGIVCPRMIRAAKAPTGAAG